MGSFIFLKKDRFGLPPGRKVVKAAEYRDLIAAEEILEAARREADRIREEAKQAFEDEKTRGYEDGILEGKMETAERMMETVTRTVGYFESVEGKVVDIVVSALRKILGQMDDRELVTRVVKNALNVVRNQRQVTLRVNPAQAPAVRESLSEILAGFPGVSFLDVVPDARLQAGGCILESELGVVDASLDVQVEAIRKALEKSFKGKAGRDEG